jgi:ParB family chromosome partitioning protein
MTQLTTVPFSKLVASDTINARPATKEGLEELAASILAKGIIQPLCVRPAETGDKFELIDGRRRFAAMAKLVKDKKLPKSHPVPVIVRNEDDATALESSLIANTVRLPMHPVDQYAVFAKLGGEGVPDAEIAARFGISERTVRQQKALGRLAPAIREAWRKEKIGADVARAFAEHADPAVQEALYQRLKSQGPWALSEHNVRRELGGPRVPVSRCDELLLVGEEAYLAAGGTLTESLFAEDRFVDDVPLVKKIARDRLQAECERLKGEGWAWAKVNLDKDDPQEWDFDALRDEIDDDETSASYTAEERARSGCIVSIDATRANPPFAEIKVAYGLLAREDEEPGVFDDADDDAGSIGAEFDGEENHEAASAGTSDAFAVSGALLASMTEAMTHAAAKALAADPALAQKIITAALLTRHMAPANVRNDGMPELRRERFASFSEALAALMASKQDRCDVLFAEAVASTFDLRSETWKFKTRDSGVEALRDALPAHWYLAAMREAFDPADYFKRAGKETTLAALEEIVEAGAGAGLAPIDVLADMKKADLAAAAAGVAKACGWLPPQLRHPAYALEVAQRTEAAE